MKTIEDIERAIVEKVEVLEGKVPSDADIAMHTSRQIFPGNVYVFYWKGRRIFDLIISGYNDITIITEQATLAGKE